MKLIIVESPNKIKKIKKFVGNEYTVLATCGHLYNLKKKIDPFNPAYELLPKKTKYAKGIQHCWNEGGSQGGGRELYIATDNDRSGDGISGEILDLLGLTCENVGVYRSTFNE